MLHRQLKNITGQLRQGDLKVSDALLITSRYLRPCLPPDRLLWLNRELLGYRKDDLSAIYERRRSSQFQVLVQAPRRPFLEIPTYRFLSGVWGKVDNFGRLVCREEPHLSDKCIFCNIGIQQIETQLAEMEEPLTSLFSMSIDEDSGLEFYCWSKELVRVHEAVRAKLCEFIETVIDELELASNQK
jgi:hypothetical protein